ncbi:MAG: C_GCAxxG_C_C family protein [Paludibacteraceae bacterium]|nr:C_GCAxxG_C_C family protein [Paludibacteraceae bacterium]
MAALTQEQIEQRAQQAKEYFKQGYNCAQAVAVACCDLCGMDDKETAARISAGFGGGIGRMRLTCGAASGMFMLAGLQAEGAQPLDAEGKQRTYARVRRLADAYKAEFGSITCAELLGLKPAEDGTPCRHIPCAEMVAQAVRIFLTTRAE